MNMTPAANINEKIPRQELHLLFSLFSTMMIGAVSRAGGIRLANQFEQQLNRHARQHGWNISTSPGDIVQGAPDLNDETLLAAYRSIIGYALTLARQILGERLIASTLADLADSLPPQLRQTNDRYEFFKLP